VSIAQVAQRVYYRQRWRRRLFRGLDRLSVSDGAFPEAMPQFFG